jgi:hypothetical protein
MLGMGIYMLPHAHHCVAHLQVLLPALASETNVYLAYAQPHYYAHWEAPKFQCPMFKV